VARKWAKLVWMFCLGCLFVDVVHRVYLYFIPLERSFLVWPPQHCAIRSILMYACKVGMLFCHPVMCTLLFFVPFLCCKSLSSTLAPIQNPDDPISPPRLPQCGSA